MISMNKRMKVLVVLPVLGAGLSAAGVVLAGEVAPTGTMQVEPSTVEPGGTYVISNDPESPCLLGQVSGDTGGVRPGAWFAEPDGSGNWSVTIEVPANGAPDAMGNPTPFPPGVYEQHAFCEQPTPADAGSAAPAQQAEFAYDPVDVTVVAAQEEPAPPPEPETPPAAQPAAEAPTFTG